MMNKQTILIAGATGNIGGGAAVALAKRGARVMLLGRKLETLETRADSIRVALSEAQIEYQETDIATLVVDFSDMESVRLAAAEAMSRFPMIHGLVLSNVALVQNGPNILPNGHDDVCYERDGAISVHPTVVREDAAIRRIDSPCDCAIP